MERELAPTLKVNTDDEVKTTPRSERIKRRKLQSPSVSPESLYGVLWREMKSDEYLLTYKLDNVTEIASGAYGTVFKVLKGSSSYSVALKIFFLDSDSTIENQEQNASIVVNNSETIDSATREVAALKIIEEKANSYQLQSLPKFIDNFYMTNQTIKKLSGLEILTHQSNPTQHKLFSLIHEKEKIIFVIVTKFEENAFSIEYLKVHKSPCLQSLDDYKLLLIFKQFLDTVHFLHKNNIYHTDIHSGNVLLICDPTKPIGNILIDFGLSCSMEKDSKIACSNFSRLKDRKIDYSKEEILEKYDLRRTYGVFISLIKSKEETSTGKEISTDLKNMIYIMFNSVPSYEDARDALSNLSVEIFKKTVQVNENRGEMALLQTLWNTKIVWMQK